MKVRRGRGDDGTTSLADGTRVPKSDPRLAVLGELDELNCRLGAARLELPRRGSLRRRLPRIQSELFLLFQRGGAPAGLVRGLELEIREMERALPRLKGFLLPGASRASAALHLARSACRRAERASAALPRPEPVSQAYLNRLSDWLFAAARRVS